jgi:hypothetical protein
MLLGAVVVTLIASVAVFVNDHTPWGGPEFSELTEDA